VFEEVFIVSNKEGINDTLIFELDLLPFVSVAIIEIKFSPGFNVMFSEY